MRDVVMYLPDDVGAGAQPAVEHYTVSVKILPWALCPTKGIRGVHTGEASLGDEVAETHFGWRYVKLEGREGM